MCAAIFRPTQANYTVSENYEVDTEDHEDHTFCGVMFSLECKRELPVDFIEVYSISVRGELGPMTVWVTPDTFLGKNERPDLWEKVYEGNHESSCGAFTKLSFPRPVVVAGGTTIGMYVHSKVDGDGGVVYDNQRGHTAHEDTFIGLGPGFAHLSNKPFSPHGFWGRAWRSRRQFVGRVAYGAKYKLWNPVGTVHHAFPMSFRRLVRLFVFGIKPYQPGCPISTLSNDILFYILNMCRWDWVPPMLGDEMPQLFEEDQEENDEENDDTDTDTNKDGGDEGAAGGTDRR